MRNRIPTYRDLGFDEYGLNIVEKNKTQSNLADFFADTEGGQIFNRNISKVTGDKITSISANKVTTGTFSAVTKVGGDSIELNGEDKAIRIYDSSGHVSILIKGA